MLAQRHTLACALKMGRDGGLAAGNANVQGSGFRVQGSGFRVQGSGFRVQGSGFRVHGSGFMVQGSGFRQPVMQTGWEQGDALEYAKAARPDITLGDCYPFPASCLLSSFFALDDCLSRKCCDIKLVPPIV